MKVETSYVPVSSFDARSGAHINVYDFTDGGDGKGPHFLFPGNYNAVQAILNQLFGG